MTKAVYAGSFDMPTKGHESVIRAASKIFDRLIVAIALNPAKKTMFTDQERFYMLTAVTLQFPNVAVDFLPPHIYTVNYAEKADAQFVVRGLRNILDFVNEQVMAEKNLIINPRIQTVFLMPDHKYSNVASSTVKQMMGPEGWEEGVKEDIPEVMWPRFIELVRTNKICPNTQ